MLRAITLTIALMWLGLLVVPEPLADAVGLLGAGTLLVLLLVDRWQARRATAYVYLMGGHPDGIKIGRTNNLARRLKEHQTALPGAYYILTIPTLYPGKLERQLHKRYAHKRIWSDREYFRLTNADVRDIRRM